ncbi:MAG: hypothetical protein H7A45_14205 [Verrucomicrobiales bacterium]|nr:hypothetical protein [Verrucomicrobiales bacterium]MCP5527280.1 hypothetical protein [Verrucomicrobiales bacterium]
MNAWIRNEWRLLRGAWMAAVALALLLPTTVHLLWPEEHWATLVGYGVLLAGCLGLSAMGFGAEFAQGTATLLFSQPVDRRQLWRRKITAAAAATVSLLLIGLLVMALLDPVMFTGVSMTPTDQALAMLGPGGLLLAAAGGGLCFSILTRRISGAFWLTGLTSVALWVGVSVLIWLVPGLRSSPDSQQWQIGLWWGLVVVSGLAGIGLSRRMVVRLQDLPVGGSPIEFPSFRRRTRRATGLRRRGRRSGIRTLRRKEWRLQQLSFITAGLLTLLTILAVITMKAWGLQEANPMVWPVLAFTWGLIPLLVGAVAVAEERWSGIHAWQQTLPVAVSRQWRIKVMTCLRLAFLLGVVLPTVVDILCLRFAGLWKDDYLFAVVPVRLVLWVAGTLAGLYASSLSRNLMHCLTILAVMGAVVAGSILGADLLWGHLRPTPIHLAGLICGTLLGFGLLWLAGRNFRGDAVDARLLGLNGIVVGGLLGLGIGLTALTYQRSWEVFAAEDVRQPWPVKSGIEPKVVAAMGSGMTAAALMPDGSLWAYHSGNFPPWPAAGDSPETRCLSDAGEWRDVAACGEAVYAIREDGSLWGWGYRYEWTNSLPAGLPRGALNPWDRTAAEFWRRYGLIPPPMEYVKAFRKASPGTWGLAPATAAPSGDASTNEKTPVEAVAAMANADLPPTEASTNAGIATGPGTFLMTRYGVLPDSAAYSGLVARLVLPPEQPWRVGTDTNWTAIAGGDHHVVGLKADGTLWAWGFGFGESKTEGLPPASTEPVRWLDGTNWVSLTTSLSSLCLALGSDGEVRQHNRSGYRHALRIATASELPFGPDSRLLGGANFTVLVDGGELLYHLQSVARPGAEGAAWQFDPLEPSQRWRTAAPTDEALWAIRDDGSLWQWTFNRRNPPALAGPGRQGRRRDWIGLTGQVMGGGLGLTADGGLWLLPDRRQFGVAQFLLAPTRRPYLLTRFGPRP